MKRALLASLLVVILLASCGPKPPTIEEQRRAFESWYADVSVKTKVGDDTMQIVSDVMAGYASGRFSRYDAYDVIKTCYANIDALWMYLGRLKPPEGLSSANSKTLKEAIESLSTAQFCRRNGLKAFLDFLDSPSPAKLSEASSEFDSALEFIMTAAGKLASLKAALEIE